jgi:hypothetical protein
MQLDDLLENPELLRSLFSDPLQMLPVIEQNALRRCALVRNFDEDLYSSVLKTGDGPEFKELITNRYIRRLPGKWQFTLDDQMRERLLSGWQQPEELVHLSEELAKHYKAEQNLLETSFHLIIANPAEAYMLLKQEIDPAAETYDLTRLYALQELLEKRKSQFELMNRKLTNELNQLRRELRALYETRALWANAYFETRIYQERQQSAPLLQQLRIGDDFWLLQLFAAGGVGKTMYLRAVIADHCVPNRWPVAKIDFDYVPHMEQVVDQPWRLLLTIADQLNSQIRGRPFKSLLDSNQEYIAQADPTSYWLVRPLQPLTAVQPADKQAEIVEHFSSVIPPGQPYLLIFDTLEQLRHRQITLEKLFELLLDLRARSADVRVVLSGRFNLEEPLPGQTAPTAFTRLFGAEAKTVQLEPFTDDEAHSYLTNLRKLPHDEPLLQAMIKKSEGNPFKLALLAEIVESDPSITAAQIEAYESADFAYLIERIVMRISEPWVRWLLRYGVVPRQLTERFVNEVIVPAVAELKSGRRSDDDPEQDQLSQYSRVIDDPFSIVTLSPEPPDDLWGKLKEYASNYSWVQPAEQADALRFQPEVVRPMRELLSRHLREGRQIYLALQQAAFRYYDNLVREDGQPQDLQEAVYHNYLAEEGDDYWLSGYREYQDDDRMIRGLANEVADLVNSGVSAGERVQALAAYELAYRSLPGDRRPQPGDIRSLEESLQQARQLNAADYVGGARLAMLEGCLLLAQNNIDELLKLIAPVKPEDDRTRLDLALLQIHALKGRVQLDEIENVVKQAEQWIANLAGSHSARDRRFAKRAQQLVIEQAAIMAGEQERLPEADRYYARLLELVDDEAVTEICRYASHRINLLAQMAQEQRAKQVGERAIKRLQKLPGDNNDVAVSLAWLQAEIDLVRQRPDEAQQHLAEAKPPPDTNLAWRDLRARVSAACLQISDAVGNWQAVVSQAPRDAALMRFQAYISCSRLYLEVLSDKAQAENYLNYLNEATAQIDTPSLSTLPLLQAQLLRLHGKPEEARWVLLDALNDALPSVKVKLLTNLLATEEKEYDYDRVTNWLGQLCAELDRVQPDQRLSLLGDLVNCPSFGRPDDRTLQSLTRLLLDHLPPIDPNVHDPTLATLRLVEVHRAFGDQDRARKLLDRIDDERPQVLSYIHRAYDRLGWWPTRLLEANDIITRLLGQQPADELVLLLLLEQIERLLIHGETNKLPHLANIFDLSYASHDALVRRFVDILLDRFGSAWQLRIFRLREIGVDHERTLEYLQRGLTASRELDDRAGEGRVLAHIGDIYYALSDYDRALDYLQRSLVIIEEVDDRAGKGRLLTRIGDIYYALSDYHRALDYLQQSLVIIEEVDDRAGKGRLLTRIGDIYYALSHYDRALHYLQHALAIMRGVGDRAGEGRVLAHIGDIYYALSDYDRALHYLQHALAIMRGVGDRAGEAHALTKIENVNNALESKEMAQTLQQEPNNYTAGATLRVDRATVRLGKGDRSIMVNDQELYEAIDPNEAIKLEEWVMTESTPPWRFSREFTNNWRAIGDLFGRLLLGDRLRVSDKLHHLSAELPANVSYLPWELAQNDGRPFVMTERFPSFYRSYHSQQPLEQRRGKVDVLLLRLGAGRERIEQRGYSESGGDSGRLFSRHGLSVETLEQPELPELRDVLRVLQPSVLYMEANVIESQLGPALYFGGSRFSKGISSEFTARGLANALHGMRGAPLLILDVPAASELSENVRQLCMRNALAAELANHDHVSAVIASGLADSYRVEKAPIELLVPALADRLPVRDVVSQLWQIAAGQIDWSNDEQLLLAHLLPFAGTSLLTREPMRVLELG